MDTLKVSLTMIHEDVEAPPCDNQTECLECKIKELLGEGAPDHQEDKNKEEPKIISPSMTFK